MDYLVETPGKSDILSPDLPVEGERIKPQVHQFEVKVPLAKPVAVGDSLDLRFSLQTFVCSETSSLCQIKSFVWNIPVTFADSRIQRHDSSDDRGQVSRVALSRCRRYALAETAPASASLNNRKPIGRESPRAWTSWEDSSS